ncbi:D-amino-acid oxidase [Multifurca ochricompacta]|uniref:D-amino-acid oxidase n=1 Tax=Multifurca ochricompacta TaxID=376703 RepID=A0AAD4M9N7_9AGAM|nr:D-amino-acid oxidase [Multifurca ochricompacta]
MTQKHGKNIVIIGAGVIGLTTAIKIQEKGDYSVTVLAETFPTDSKCIRYTRGHHVSAATDDLRQQQLERETLDVMWKMSALGDGAEGCFLRAPQTEYYISKEGNPDLSFSPNFQRLEASAFTNVAEAVSAVTFSALNINTPTYLPYLLARFLGCGGHIIRACVQHITQVLEGGVEAFADNRSGGKPIDGLVICAGLGARTLGGVEDKDLYPVRGQTVLLRAPWVEEGRSLVVESGSKTYIIPRRGGTVIVGGTREANDWYPIPRPETTVDILEPCTPSVRKEREPTVEDLKPLIIEEGCGFRPARRGGIRLQSEWVKVPGSERCMIPVVYNYGHGGYGFQTSWGSASVALDLLEGALAEGPNMSM